jgi:fructose-bisphosphate aldolase class II
MFDACYSKYAIAAVNVWDMPQIHGLFRAAQKAGAPFIVQIYPDTRFAIHLDHGDTSHALDSMESGAYNSVMIDASHEPFRTNIRITKEIVDKAHARDITVEAELGVLAGVEDDLIVDGHMERYTRPAEVEEFVRETACDSLAVAVGTSHGAYKFSGGKGLQFDILSEIGNRLPGFPLVLHGGSEIQRINVAGGQLGMDAKGVSGEELVKAIGVGVCKVNIATDARLIWTRVHREFLKYNPAQFDPIVPGRTFMEAFEDFLLEKFELLGSTGKAKQLTYVS